MMRNHIAYPALVLFCATALFVGCQKKNATPQAPLKSKDSTQVADSTKPKTDATHQAADSSSSNSGSTNGPENTATSDTNHIATDTAQHPADTSQHLGDTSNKAADTTQVPKPVILSYEQFQGKVLFTKYCVVCHGELGKGDGFNSFNLDPKPGDLSDLALMKPLTDEHVAQVIREGGQGVNKSPLMPSWGGRLSKNELLYVTRYVRMLSQPNP